MHVCNIGAIANGCAIAKTQCAGVPKAVARTPAPVAQVVADPTKNNLMKKCCTAAGIPSACMQYCQYEVSNPKEMACDTDCLASMRVINACAANGEDNTACCQATSGFPSQCLSYCAGNAPAASTVFNGANIGTYMPCFNSGMTIMQCHKQHAPSTPNWPASLQYNAATTDKFPASATSMTKGYCAIQTGNVLGAVGGASSLGSLGSLVNGFGG